MPGYVMACVGRPRQTGPMGSNRRRLLVFGFRQVSTFFDVIKYLVILFSVILSLLGCDTLLVYLLSCLYLSALFLWF